MFCRFAHKTEEDTFTFYKVWFNNLHVFKNHLDEIEIYISSIVNTEGHLSLENLDSITIGNNDTINIEAAGVTFDCYVNASYICIRFKLPNPITVKCVSNDAEWYSDNNFKFDIMRGNAYLNEVKFNANESYVDLVQNLQHVQFDMYLEASNTDYDYFWVSISDLGVSRFGVTASGFCEMILMPHNEINLSNPGWMPRGKVNYQLEGF